MKKRVLAVALTAVLAASIFTGCGSKKDYNGPETKNGKTVIKVAASTTPHAEILEHVKETLAKQNIDLQVKEFDDYIQPNNVVESGEFDANYFQHVVYLDNFNQEKGTHLGIAGKIHYEPFGIYAGKKKALSELSDGDSIAVPNDTTNEARALLLLQDNGIIKLTDGAGLKATKQDIVENPKNVKIQELEAAQVSRVINECAFVVLNGNYAQAAKLSVKDALVVEKASSQAAENYANVIAVKQGYENNEAIQKLISALKSEDTQKWMEEKYQGAVVSYTGK